MKMAKGPPQKVPSSALAFPTVTANNRPFLLTTPTAGINTSDIQPLVSLPTLLEHNFDVHLAVPNSAHIKTCKLCQNPIFKGACYKADYGGFIKTPPSQGNEYIVLKYDEDRLWRLPVLGENMRAKKAPPLQTENSFAVLQNISSDAFTQAPSKMPKMNLTPIDHDKDQLKFMRMQEIEKEAMEIHCSYGHCNANITIATARFHGRKISKALAKAIRKIKCADCALGHGNRKTIHTKRRPAERTSGLSLADSDSANDWFN